MRTTPLNRDADSVMIGVIPAHFAYDTLHPIMLWT
jgi:hypothetical protein